MKTLVIQPNCRAYRVKVFDELSKAITGLDLLHFGPKKFADNQIIHEYSIPKFQISNLHWIKDLYKLVKSYDTVIVVFDPHYLNAFFLSLFFNKKIIYWGHGLGKSRVLNYFRYLVGNKARALITYDEKGKADLINIGLDAKKIFVANNTQFISNSQDLSSHPKNSFLYVGRIQERKKVADLLEAFSLVKNKLPLNTQIVVLGDGDHVAELKNKAVHLKIEDCVQFVDGTTNDATLKSYFARAYAYVSPGHVGLGVLHSFAYGVPVITYRGNQHAPEYSNIINAVSGYIVEPGIAQLADALVQITQQENYRVLGENAFKHYAHNRTIAQMVQGFKAAIQHRP